MKAFKSPESVLVVIHTPELQVLLLERAAHAGYWQSVTGSQEDGESLLATAALWFAPALVVFRHVAPVDAVMASLRAVLKNVLPFLLYGLIQLVLAVAASIPFGLGWLVLLPVMLLSGIMLPITRGFAPDWLYWVSRCNPVAYVVDAARAAFLGDFTSWHFWIGTLITVVMVVVGLAVSTRAFARQSS